MKMIIIIYYQGIYDQLTFSLKASTSLPVYNDNQQQAVAEFDVSRYVVTSRAPNAIIKAATRKPSV